MFVSMDGYRITKSSIKLYTTTERFFHAQWPSISEMAQRYLDQFNNPPDWMNPERRLALSPLPNEMLSEYIIRMNMIKYLTLHEMQVDSDEAYRLIKGNEIAGLFREFMQANSQLNRML